jgi:hypothetical protein
MVVRKAYTIEVHLEHMVYSKEKVRGREIAKAVGVHLKLSMFWLVVTAGWVPVLMACCSAGRPNESQP